MKDEFTNRLGMFDTTLLNLNTDNNKAVWFQQPPVIFTTKTAEATAAVADLRAFCVPQQTAITGAAVDKEREGREAIAVAHPLARAPVTWFRDEADETNAAKVDLQESGWRRLRDQQVVDMGRLVRELAQEVVAGRSLPRIRRRASSATLAQDRASRRHPLQNRPRRRSEPGRMTLRPKRN